MIEGTWHLVRGEQDGENIPESDVRKSKLRIAGDVHNVTLGDVVIKGTHKLGTDQTPMTIDASDSEGPFAGNTMLGIFKLEDGVFTVCFAAPGQARPVKYTTMNGQANILHYWTRDS